jgi:hypothetical protein
MKTYVSSHEINGSPIGSDMDDEVVDRAAILGNPRGEGQCWAGHWDRQLCALDAPEASGSFHGQQMGADGQML